MSSEYAILKDGQVLPVFDIREWAKWFENFDNRRVDKTQVGDVEISTVFLGLDHSFGHGPKLWFETMIFGGKFDQEQWRYSTLEEAKAGHIEAVDLVKKSEVGF